MLLAELAQIGPWAGVPVADDLLVYFAPLIALTVTMLAVVACPILLGRSPRVVATVAVIGVIATLLLTVRTGSAVAQGGVSGLSTDLGSGLLIADNLSVFFQLVLGVFLLAVIWLWWLGSAETEQNAPEFFILLLGSALGMMLMTSTTNLLMIVVAVETASLPSFAMVGFAKRDRAGAEASLKYMIFGAISTAIMLYGASLLYGVSGSLYVADLAHYLLHNAEGTHKLLLMLGLLFFFAGICFKISAVPFHFWCPDAFEGAKIEVTTWLSVVSKAAGLVLLVRLVLVFCSSVEHAVSMQFLTPLAWAIGVVAAVTCTVGNFAAYAQQSIKRMLAYSSIAHAGYMMMAAAVFVYSDKPAATAGLTALLIYITIYMFMNLGAFGVTAIVIWNTGSDRIEAFSGLMRRAPLLAVPMIICLVSLVGIPPMAGYMGKFWVLMALSESDSVLRIGQMKLHLGWILIIIASANTLVSLYYYMRVVVQMVSRKAERPAIHGPVGGVVLVNVCAVVLLALLIFVSPLKTMAERYSRNLFVPRVMSTAAADQPQSTPARLTSLAGESD